MKLLSKTSIIFYSILGIFSLFIARGIRELLDYHNSNVYGLQKNPFEVYFLAAILSLSRLGLSVMIPSTPKSISLSIVAA